MSVRIIHISLIISLFMSTSGLMVNDHFCKSENKHYTSLFNSDQGCTSKICSDGSCCSNSEDDQEENNCCDTKNKLVKLDSPQEIIIPEITEIDFKLLPVLDLTVFRSEFLKTNQIKHCIYDLPYVIFDISVLYQVFLC